MSILKTRLRIIKFMFSELHYLRVWNSGICILVRLENSLKIIFNEGIYNYYTRLVVQNGTRVLRVTLNV